MENLVLHDVAFTKKEKEELKKSHGVPNQDKYPYWSRIDFGHETTCKIPALKKASVGDRLKIEMEVLVTRVTSTSDSTYDKKDKDEETRVGVELQITKMGCVNQEDFSEAFSQASKNGKAK